RWIELVGPTRFFMSYGMSEGLGLCAIRGDEWLRHPGSVGRPWGATVVRILGDDGRDLPSGEIGEIFLMTPARERGAHRVGEGQARAVQGSEVRRVRDLPAAQRGRQAQPRAAARRAGP